MPHFCIRSFSIFMVLMMHFNLLHAQSAQQPLKGKWVFENKSGDILLSKTSWQFDEKGYGTMTVYSTSRRPAYSCTVTQAFQYRIVGDSIFIKPETATASCYAQDENESREKELSKQALLSYNNLPYTLFWKIEAPKNLRLGHNQYLEYE